MAKAILKTLHLPNKAMTSMLNSAIVRYTIKIGTLDMHNLNRFHCLINCSNPNEVSHLDFAMC